MSGQETKGEKGRIFDAKTEWLKFCFKIPTYVPHQIHINSQDNTPNCFNKNTPSPDHHEVQSANVKNAFFRIGPLYHLMTWRWYIFNKTCWKNILTLCVFRYGAFVGIIKNFPEVHGLTKFKIEMRTLSCTMTWIDVKVFDYKTLYRNLSQYKIECNKFYYHQKNAELCYFTN